MLAFELISKIVPRRDIELTLFQKYLITVRKIDFEFFNKLNKKYQLCFYKINIIIVTSAPKNHLYFFTLDISD